ncbi:hypothetical protein BOTBODRAFT_32898 [Botryobasidium botryosum FD-172 SS1]|uniref:Uncharacterized protein n=1 Tax=Botryobasidium botryosum (strain FD-172 SS1) TaxID=930990 RepID=A0A067MEX5_BOTB1|nr:hypothetical protein BOTBODRAFT_32898 [Botryobasidium botryosum FD-172 SS1]
MATPPPELPLRTVEIKVDEEVIAIDLDGLDRDPEDLLLLLKDGTGSFTAGQLAYLASEYWRKGWLDSTEKVANAAIEHLRDLGNITALPALYSLLANIQLAYARGAPKHILSNPRSDDQRASSSKEVFLNGAAAFLNLAEKAEVAVGVQKATLGHLTRGIYLLSTRSMDEALRSFEGVLQMKPTNIVALLGKARILYARRQHREALRIFQQVLRYNPKATPDPRIGIGLCFWALGNHEKAKMAWQRSLEVHPNDWPAKLLLGIESINQSKDTKKPDEERAAEYKNGLTMIEQVFKADKTCASAANALSELFLRRGEFPKALKLAEHTIQFADTLAVVSDGHLRMARVSHAQNMIEDAAKHYEIAAENSPHSTLAQVGLAQLQVKADETLAAIHTLEKLTQPRADKPDNNGPCLEALIMLASLRSHPRPALSSSDAAQERTRARELFDTVTKLIEAPDASRSHRLLGEDVEMYVEIARLWQTENLDRASKALQEAVRIRKASGSSVHPKLINNLAAVKHLEGEPSVAQVLYEEALPNALSLEGEEADTLSTTILYNLARSYEDQGETGMAKDAYKKLLGIHPEYVDAKARLALMLIASKQYDEAHQLLKQGLSSPERNGNIRALYIYFLCHVPSLYKAARSFTYNLLKDDRHDVYALCAAGFLHYQEARENRHRDPASLASRSELFIKSANIFLSALQYDPACAVAAQGLAIIIAEDVLEANQASDEASLRLRHARNTRQALDIFAKVRESLSDGSVYINMGHCYFARDEYDKAIESYETASRRFYNGQNVSALLFLARTWFAKATKASSFTAMRQALKFAQQALHIQANDKAILYNLAMIEQKTGELLFSLGPEKRTLADLQYGIEHAAHAQKLFASLAADTSGLLPYNTDIANERRKYGDTMLRKSTDQLAAQEKYETENRARLEVARKARQEEKERLDAIQREKAEEERRRAEAMAERRRKATEEAKEWAARARAESDEEEIKKQEKSRKAAARKTAKAEESGEDGEPKERKRKRRLKSKKAANSGEDEKEEALFTDDDAATGDAKPRRPRAKKRAVDDDEGENENDLEAGARGKKRKTFKSKETISDSDEE